MNHLVSILAKADVGIANFAAQYVESATKKLRTPAASILKDGR
jgi:hypothetical protein